MFDFIWFFSRIGWRWPVDDRDGLEIWRGLTLVTELPGWLIKANVTHFITGVALQGQLAERMAQDRVRRPLAYLPPFLPPKVLSPRLPGAQGRRLRGRRQT